MLCWSYSPFRAGVLPSCKVSRPAMGREGWKDQWSLPPPLSKRNHSRAAAWGVVGGISERQPCWSSLVHTQWRGQQGGYVSAILCYSFCCQKSLRDMVKFCLPFSEQLKGRVLLSLAEEWGWTPLPSSAFSRFTGTAGLVPRNCFLLVETQPARFMGWTPSLPLLCRTTRGHSTVWPHPSVHKPWRSKAISLFTVQ